MVAYSRRAVMGSAAGAVVASAVPVAVRARVADATSGGAEQAIAAGIRKAIEDKAIPGAVVAVARGGELLHQAAFGLANLETGTPMFSDTVLRVGSLTKQFTAAAVIALAAQGRVDLAAPVARYLPAFEMIAPFSLLELMHHTAGLHSDESGDDSVAAEPAPRSQVELADLIATQAEPFDFPPGTAWLYSNANYIVLGAVIEQVTGKPFSEAMASLIFEPLALSHSAVDDPRAVVAGRASGYTPTGEGDAPFVNATWVDPTQSGGAGAVRSTIADLCRWHDLLLSERLFDRTYLDLMLAPGRLRDGRLSGDNRFSAEDASYGDTQYACGLLVSGPSQSEPSILHYGYFYGFSAVLQTWLGPRLTFAVLCNADPGPGLPFRAVRRAVSEGWLDARG